MVRQESEVWRFVDRQARASGNPKGDCKFCGHTATINAGAWWHHLNTCTPAPDTLTLRQQASLSEAKRLARKELAAATAKLNRKQAQLTTVAAAAARADELGAGADGGGGSSSGGGGSGTNLANTQIGAAFARTGSQAADEAIARCFFVNGLPLRLADDKYFRDMITAVQATKSCYVPPHRQKLTQKNGLLEQEIGSLKRKQEVLIAQDKDKYGLTIVSDGFTDAARRPLLNVVLLSPKGEYFVEAIDSSGHKKTMQYVADKVRLQVQCCHSVRLVACDLRMLKGMRT
jgi:hypothetical protein